MAHVHGLAPILALRGAVRRPVFLNLEPYHFELGIRTIPNPTGQNRTQPSLSEPWFFLFHHRCCPPNRCLGKEDRDQHPSPVTPCNAEYQVVSSSNTFFFCNIPSVASEVLLTELDRFQVFDFEL